MTDKKVPDWAVIELEFRQGLKPLRQIADEQGTTHTTISRQAKKFSWVRDLAERIRTTAQARLASDPAPDAAPRSSERSKEAFQEPSGTPAVERKRPSAEEMQRREDEVVEQAANTQVAVIRSHKRNLTRLGDLREQLTIELESATGGWQVLMDFIDMVDESGPDEKGRFIVDKKAQMMRTILEMPDRVEALKKLVEIDEKLRKGEREAYGIDKVKEEKSGLEALLDRLAADMAAGRVVRPASATPQ